MNQQGWISLHRKIEDNPIFQNEKALKIWIWLLIRANHTPADVLIGRNLIHLKVGQSVFGSDVACERLKMSKSTIHFWLHYLKVERYIERKTTNKYSIITILNYERYQTVERQVEYRRNAKRTPSVQPNETNNTINTDNTYNNNNTLVDKITSWAYKRARVNPSCSQDSFKRSVLTAIDRVGEVKVKRVFEMEENAIQFLQNIKTL